MGINTTLESASTTAASNGPSGSDQRTVADDALRQYLAFIKSLKTLATLASNTTVTPPSTANAFSVTGTTAITTIASTNSWDGRDILFIFAGILTFTHGSNLILPGSANITTAVGDAALMVQLASGQWRCVAYARADGSLVVGTQTLTALTLTGNLSVQGNTTLGNADTDTVITNGNVTLNAPSSGATINVNTGGQGIKITTSVARGGGLSFLDFYDPTGAKGEIGFGGATDDLYITNILSGNLFLGTLNITGLTITSDRRVYGTALHNNAGAVTGTTNQYIASGTYTPTLTGVTNVTTTTARVSQWIRVGNVVTVSGSFSLTATLSSAVELGISLPIASSLSGDFQCAGMVSSDNTSQPTPGPILGDNANDRARYKCASGLSGVAVDEYFHFTYVVV